MPAKQESITFPIRKAKSSRSKSGKLGQQIERQDARNDTYDCAEVFIDEEILSDSNSSSSPRGTVAQRRTSSRIQPTVHSTRRSSRKKCPISYRETSLSPQKKQFNEYSKDTCTPKKLAFGEESSPERASTIDYLGTSVTPSKNGGSLRNVRASSRNRECVTSYQETRRNETSIQDDHFTTPKKLFPEAVSLNHTSPRTPSRSQTPNRNSRSRDKDQELLSPTKRKVLSPGICYFSVILSFCNSNCKLDSV